MVRKCDAEVSEANLVAEEAKNRKFGYAQARISNPPHEGKVTFEVDGKSFTVDWGDRSAVLNVCPTELEPEKAKPTAPETGRLFINTDFAHANNIKITEPKRPINTPVSGGRWVKVQMQSLRGQFVAIDVPGRPVLDLDLGDANLIDWTTCRLGDFGGRGFEIFVNGEHSSMAPVPHPLVPAIQAAVHLISTRPHSGAPDTLAQAKQVVADALQLLILDPNAFDAATRKLLRDLDLDED